MRAHYGLVLHVQVGDNSCYGEFVNPANQASSTWWVSKTGVLEQYVDSDDTAWTEMAGNSTWDSVETEGLPSEPLTQQQVVMLARLYAWGHELYGWPFQITNSVSGRGFGWHGMGGPSWGNHPHCPGDIRKAQRIAILALAQGQITTVGSAQEATTVFILPHPNGKRLDVFAIPPSGIPNHYWTDDSANLGAMSNESLGGIAKTLSACWQNGLLYVTAHGSDDHAWLKVSNGSKWVTDWSLLTKVGLLHSS